MSPDNLIAFWLAVALVVVVLIAAFGWLVALSLARDAAEDRRELRESLRKNRSARDRLSELRFLNSRLVSRIRDVEPKGGKR